MKERERIAFYQFYIKNKRDMTTKEMANIWNLNHSTFRNRVHRFKKRFGNLALKPYNRYRIIGAGYREHEEIPVTELVYDI